MTDDLRTRINAVLAVHYPQTTGYQDVMYFVQLSPDPTKPAWHVQSKPRSYPFPTIQAAERFAASHQGKVVK